MFKKIVSNLSFSPGAASQLTFYMRRLKQEDLTRKLSAIAGAFALVFQMAAVVSPATSAVAASTNDIIFGGLDRSKPKEDLLKIYDKNTDGKHQGYQKLFAYFGISRADLAKTTRSTINSNNQELRSLGRNPHSNLDKRVEVGGQAYYLRPLYTWGSGVSYEVLEGKRADGTWFAIMLDCGNLVIKDQVHVVQNLKCENLKVDKAQGRVPLKVAFTAKAEAKNQKITNYIFKFGDGNKKDSKDRTVSHKYEKPGNYVATVQIEGSTGDKTEIQDQCSVSIKVKEEPTEPVTDEPSIVCVDLSANKAGGPVPIDVEFTTQARANKQEISEYIYDFGDGSRISSKNDVVSHTYTQAGSYVAKVSVKGSKTSQLVTSEDCQVTITPTVETQPEDVPGNIEISKSALYMERTDAAGQLANANATTAKATETIQYTLVTKNTGGATVKGYVVKENINDILEYAEIFDAGGGTLDGGLLTWAAQDIAAGQTLVNTFRVKVKSPIPATPRSSSDPLSFDLRMDNVYGNTISINLEVPPEKQVEVAASTLPQTGAGENLAIMFAFISMVVYFYMRNRQLVAELAVLNGDLHGHHHRRHK